MGIQLLEAIFERQHEFGVRLGRPIPEGWYNEEGTFIMQQTSEACLKILNIIDEHATASIMEATELKDWTPWKHWSTRSGNKLVSPDNFMTPEHVGKMRMEVIDNLCFTINAAMALGMDAEMLNIMHADKVAVNHERQSKKDY